ncbi:hypothetical protein [Bacillus sp. AK128]
MINKPTFIAIIFSLLFVFSCSQHVKALTFEKLPTKQTSEQWSVQVGEAKKGAGSTKPVKGKFHTYSLTIDKVSKMDVNTVEIYLYRNDPSTTIKYSLVSCPEGADCEKKQKEEATLLAKQFNEGESYQFNNFLLAERASELEIEIVWKEEPNGRQLKETFTFTE